MPHRKKGRPLSNRQVALLVNPRSAKGKWLRSAGLRKLIHRAFPGRVFDQARDKPGMVRLAAKLSEDHDVLIVLGGDGTLADVMQGIFEAGRLGDVILGIIPVGSGNALRKSLHIPKQIRAAIKILKSGEPKPIDVIEVDGRIASFVSVGATAKATHKTSHSKIPGLLGHLLAARTMLFHPRDKREIELYDGLDDRGRSFDRKSLNLKLFDCIINKTTHFGYNWMIAPKAKIDDGYLDVTLFDIRAYSYVFYFPLIYLGYYQNFLKHYKVKSMVVRGMDLQIQYNGEILEPRDEVRLKVLPKALRVIGPIKTTARTLAEKADFGEILADKERKKSHSPSHLD
jgi:diacylglycerol kinase (ATP)